MKRNLTFHARVWHGCNLQNTSLSGFYDVKVHSKSHVISKHLYLYVDLLHFRVLEKTVYSNIENSKKVAKHSRGIFVTQRMWISVRICSFSLLEYVKYTARFTPACITLEHMSVRQTLRQVHRTGITFFYFSLVYTRVRAVVLLGMYTKYQTRCKLKKTSQMCVHLKIIFTPYRFTCCRCLLMEKSERNKNRNEKHRLCFRTTVGFQSLVFTKLFLSFSSLYTGWLKLHEGSSGRVDISRDSEEKSRQSFFLARFFISEKLINRWQPIFRGIMTERAAFARHAPIRCTASRRHAISLSTLINSYLRIGASQEKNC